MNEITVYIYTAGLVADVFGDPIAGATVYSNDTSTTTGNNGRYTIRSRHDCPLFFSATHDLYATQAVTFENPAEAAVVNFTLPFKMTTTVSPQAFNTLPQAISITSLTTAPLTGTHVIAGIGTATIELTHSPLPSDPPGFRRWVGSYIVPAGTTQQWHYVASCALDATSSSCNAGLGPRLSEVAYGGYVFDTTPPIMSTTSPSRFANVTSASSVSITWSEALSGLDTGFGSIQVDGVPRPATISGSVQSASVTLAPGVHSVRATVRDLAGNQSEGSFIFTVFQLSATVANASLREKTVAVNPNNTIPPPSSVRFAAPQVDVDSFAAQLNASTRAGHGLFKRAVSLGSVQVIFNNETGVPSVQTVNVPIAQATHQLASLSPSGGPIKTRVPQQQMTMPDIIVSVPTGYSTPGSTAQLQTKTVPLGPTTASGEVLGLNLPTRTPVFGSISACLADDGSGTTVECRIDPSGPITYARINGVEIPVLIPALVSPAEDLSDDGGKVQDCIGPACAQASPIRPGGLATLAINCPTMILDANLPAINLCSGVPGAPMKSAWTAYLNSWIYKEGPAQTPRFPIWRQDHADSPSTSDAPECPNGASGTFRGLTYRLIANTTANDESSGPVVAGTWADASNLSNELVYLGTKRGNDREFVTDSGVQFQLSNDSADGGKNVPLAVHPIEGSYLRAEASAYIDERGQRRISASSTTNGWQQGGDAIVPATAELSWVERLQIMTGTEFTQPKNAQAYDISSTLAFQLLLDMSACTIV